MHYLTVSVSQFLLHLSSNADCSFFPDIKRNSSLIMDNIAHDIPEIFRTPLHKSPFSLTTMNRELKYGKVLFTMLPLATEISRLQIHWSAGRGVFYFTFPICSRAYIPDFNVLPSLFKPRIASIKSLSSFSSGMKLLSRCERSQA